MEKRKLNKIENLYSWKSFETLQQPNWPNEKEYLEIIRKLKKAPSLILFHEIESLKSRLKKIEKGNAFLLQGGDCAETFREFSEDNIRRKLEKLFEKEKIELYYPIKEMMSDNAAMIAWACLRNYDEKNKDIFFRANPRLRINE